MAQTLEDFIGEQSRQYYQDTLNDLLDTDLWTVENRDQRIAALEAVSEDVATSAMNILQSLFSTEVNGKPIVFWKIMEQFHMAELELLHTLRDQLDAASPSELDVAPVTYDWCTDHIRRKYKEMAELQLQLQTALSSVLTKAEEL